MKPRRRALPSRGQVEPKRRRPTIRKVKPAIAPIVPRPGAPATAGIGGQASRAQIRAAPDPGRAVDLSVDLGRGLRLANPIVAAAGAFGFGVEQLGLVEVGRIGAIVTRGVTLRPRTGNRPPRTAETPGGLLNAIGLQNPGVEAVLERYDSTWAAWSVPVVVNVAADSVGGFVELVRRLEGAAGVAGVELNLGCPNASAGGLRFGLEAAAAGSLTAAVRAATDLPLLVKLSADAADVRAVARAVAEAGADAISAINTVPGLVVSAGRDRLLFGNAYGGLSGPAIKPLALRVVAEVTTAVDLPVIGMGGVTGLGDVLDFLAVGASAVGVGTALFSDPALLVRLVDELEAACRAAGFYSHRPLIGRALPRRLAPSSRAVEYQL